MAIGKSHRIVIEVDPDLKEQIYAALRDRGLTLKGWFMQQVANDLVPDSQEKSSPTGASKTRGTEDL